jgi:signal transduction histidine kinase/putative methionine-R-sulfoxide reductase with GAF domain
MGRGSKPAKSKEAKPSVTPKSPKDDGTRVRDLEKRLVEAQEQQTATTEILRVISSSPNDIQFVFDTIVRTASRLCDAFDANLVLADGDEFVQRAHHGPIGAPVQDERYPLRGTVSGRAISEARIIQVDDLAAATEYPLGSQLAQRIGYRTTLIVPLVRDGLALGAIGIRRTEVKRFTDRQIALLQTFADQAVIAIENVRLFTELQASNRELTTALDTQTATSDILSVISRSQTDAQPVFDAILQSAVRLCGALNGAIWQVEHGLQRVVSFAGVTSPEWEAIVRGFQPGPLRPPSVLAWVVSNRVALHVPDIEREERFPRARELARTMGYRSLLGVPMLRVEDVVGAIILNKADPFTGAQIELLRTFADQAVIAIENARLFKELEAANRELAAASQHKSEFLANMSHELRTPLNAIIGFSEVLSERMFGELNEKQEEYSKDIYASGTHLLSLINDILDLSKIEAGRMELELTDFHLPQAIDNALTLVRERAGRRGIALEHSVDERLGEIRGDERKVKQVLLNLLSNALKFTPEGGRVEVRAGMVDGMAEISVTDTGVGIAPEDQGAIFEEFRQVGTAAKKVEGTGLGLTLCRKFIELHGGRIWVKSQVGRGSTFTFTILVRRSE